MFGIRRQSAGGRESAGPQSGKGDPARGRSKGKARPRRGRRAGNAWMLFWVMAGTIILLVLLS